MNSNKAAGNAAAKRKGAWAGARFADDSYYVDLMYARWGAEANRCTRRSKCLFRAAGFSLLREQSEAHPELQRSAGLNAPDRRAHEVE